MATQKENLPLLDKTTEMSITRTRFAAERTLMSWIRTSFAMISFGFTIIKFFQYLKVPANPVVVQVTGSAHLGLFLILTGTFCLIPGMIEHRKTLNELSKLDGKPSWSYAFVIAILVGLIGLYALAHVLTIRLF